MATTLPTSKDAVGLVAPRTADVGVERNASRIGEAGNTGLADLATGASNFASGQTQIAARQQKAEDRIQTRNDSINRSRGDVMYRDEGGTIMRSAIEGGTDWSDPEQVHLVIQELNDSASRADAIGTSGSPESAAKYLAKKTTTENGFLDQISVLAAKAGKAHQDNALARDVKDISADVGRDPDSLNDGLLRLKEAVGFHEFPQSEVPARIAAAQDIIGEAAFDGQLRLGTPEGLAKGQAILDDPANDLLFSGPKRIELQRRALAQRRSFVREPSKVEEFQAIHNRLPNEAERSHLSGTAQASNKVMHSAFFPDGSEATVMKDNRGNFFDLQGNPTTLPPGTRVANTTNLTGGKGDLGLGRPELAALSSAEIATANTIDATQRLRVQLKGKDVVTGLSGQTLTFLDTSVDQLVQFGETFLGPDGKGAEIDGEIVSDPRKLLDESLYNLEKLGPKAAKSAAFRSNVINLAYIMARAAEPQGRLSNEDIKRQIARIGANAGRGQLMESLDEVDRNALVSFSNTHASFRSRDPSLTPIQDRFTDRLEALGGPFGDAPIPGQGDEEEGGGEINMEDFQAGVTIDQLQVLSPEKRKLFLKKKE